MFEPASLKRSASSSSGLCKSSVPIQVPKPRLPRPPAGRTPCGSHLSFQFLLAYAPFLQKPRVKSGHSMGAETAQSPTQSSLNPHRLMLITLGSPLMVTTALMIAVEMTNNPDRSRIATAIFRRFETLRCHRIGRGIDMRAASVRTFSTTRTQKFWGRKVHSGPGSGSIFQLSEYLSNRCQPINTSI